MQDNRDPRILYLFCNALFNVPPRPGLFDNPPSGSSCLDMFAVRSSSSTNPKSRCTLYGSWVSSDDLMCILETCANLLVTCPTDHGGWQICPVGWVVAFCESAFIVVRDGQQAAKMWFTPELCLERSESSGNKVLHVPHILSLLCSSRVVYLEVQGCTSEITGQ